MFDLYSIVPNTVVTHPEPCRLNFQLALPVPNCYAKIKSARRLRGNDFIWQ